jgi:CDP-diacylglycerol---serine O-phosphatidyltransferase
MSEREPLQKERGKSRVRPTFPLAKLIPNVLTLIAFSLGLTSIRYGLSGKFEMALLCIIGAAFLDALDGRVARLLKAESPMGAQLDSLADLMNFGLAPVLVLYMWGLQDLGRVGWFVLLFYGACCALRLARFNAALDMPDRPMWMRQFFVGMPTPAAGLLLLSPIWLNLGYDIDLRSTPLAMTVFSIAIAILMVSRWPTYSGKGLTTRVPREYVLPILVAFGFAAAAIFTFPWKILSVVALGYVVSLPISFMSYRRSARQLTEAQ